MRTTRPHVLAAAIGLVALGLGAACSADENPTGITPVAPTMPKAGMLAATLVTPNTNDGAVLFTVSGGAVDSVTAGDGRVNASGPSPTTVMMIGNVTTGAVLARVWIPDASKAAAYSTVVTQAAARATYQQQATTGYQVTLQLK